MFFSRLKQNENLLRRLTGGENGSSEYTFQAFDINVKLNLQVSLVKFDSPVLSSIILAKSLLFGLRIVPLPANKSAKIKTQSTCTFC
jgi:hypothetical protein